MIKDSGSRREFETGAVRDIQEGKGRCDLLPLGIVAEAFEHNEYYGSVLCCLHEFTLDNDPLHLYEAIRCALEEEDMFDGSIFQMALEVSVHFEEGAKKYGENNWQKGLPVSCYIDSAIRHYLKWERGDKDERHDRAFAWNLMCCAWEVRQDRQKKSDKKECSSTEQTNDAYEAGYKAGLLEGLKKIAKKFDAD